MIPPVRDAGYRCIAPDYAGFGRSDKPTDLGWYSYDRHTELAGTLLDDLDLREATVVVHDWGGPIGLRFAAEHPESVARLIVLNTGLFSPSERWPTPEFLRWRAFAERTGLDLPVGFIIQASTVTEIPPEVLAAYEAPFLERESKMGVAMFPLIVPLTAEDPGAAEMLRTREALARWEKPALVCFGDSDPIFQPGAARAAAKMIGSAGEPEFVEGAGHFLQEDKGEEVARRIVRFLDQS